jgi:hypothetical protein
MEDLLTIEARLTDVSCGKFFCEVKDEKFCEI